MLDYISIASEDRTQLFLNKRNNLERVHLFLNNKVMVVLWSVEEVEMFLSLISEERI